jgi:hypothetical protein
VRALEDAPRYRAALALLVEIAGKMEKNAATTQPATRGVEKKQDTGGTPVPPVAVPPETAKEPQS